MRILDAIVSGIARILHPDRPRLIGSNIRFPTDLSADEVAAALDAAAAANPAFKNWRTSIVDLIKLTHPENPDGASSEKNRAALAAELGRNDYKGSADDNDWLRPEMFKAIQQRGIPLPSGE